MKFSAELKNRAKKYLNEKFEKNVDEETINEFLTNIAILGELFRKNVSKIEKDI